MSNFDFAIFEWTAVSASLKMYELHARSIKNSYVLNANKIPCF